MSELVSNTVFGTGPNDEAAAVDVYKATAQEPVNDGKTKAGEKPAENAVMENLKKVDPRDIANAISVKDGSVSVGITKEKALDIVAGVMGGKDALEDKLLEKLSKLVGYEDKKAKLLASGKGMLPGGVANGDPASLLANAKKKKEKLSLKEVKMIVKNVKTLRKTADLSNATGIMNALNTIAGDSTFAKALGVENQMAVFGGILQQVNALRLPEAIDMLLKKAGDDKERKRLLIDNVSYAIQMSDLYTVNKALDYVGAAGVLARCPEAVAWILGFYRFPEGQTAPTIASKNYLVSTIQRIDPKWTEYSRDGNTINNLHYFMAANASAMETLKLDPLYLVPCMIAKSYPEVSLVALGKEYYPLAAL